MKFNKKGTAASEMWAPDTILFWIIFGVVLSIVGVFVVLAVFNTGSEQARIHDNLESLNLMQRFVKSPECFIYKKDGIVLNRVIDIEKYTEGNLGSCYNINEKVAPAFRLTLTSSEIVISEPTIKTTNWNDNRGFEEKLAPRGFTIFSDNKKYNGQLVIEIQNV